jgi:hypothetical protein
MENFSQQRAHSLLGICNNAKASGVKFPRKKEASITCDQKAEYAVQSIVHSEAMNRFHVISNALRWRFLIFTSTSHLYTC